MPLRSEHVQSAWWLAVAAAFLWILWLLGPILTPFLAGAVLAYILTPAVDWLAERCVPRWAAATLVLVLGFVALLAVFLVVAPLVRKEAAELASRLPGLLDRLDATIAPALEAMFGREIHVDFESLKTLVSEKVQGSEGLFGRLLASARIGGAAVAGWLGNMLLIPVVLFYLLVDWHDIVARVDSLVPRRVHVRVRAIAGEINAVLAEFLRGQLAVMGLLAAYYAGALWLGGIEFSLPIALVVGGLAFVPYLGFGTGLALALMVAALQENPTRNLVVVAMIFGIGQLLESFVLTPRIVGQRIGLHPLAVVFALLAFGQIFGFFGVLLALPASAVLLVGLRHLKGAYVASPFYGACLALVVAAGVGAAEPRTPGPQADGSVVLPNQWSLRPAGRQVAVGDFPATIAIHPAGGHAVVLHCGFGPHELVVLDVSDRKVVSRVAVEEAFQGLCFDPAGRILYASGAGGETILRFRFEAGVLVPLAPLPLRVEKERGIPAGLAVSGDGRTLLVANLWGQSVSRLRLRGDGAEVDHLALGVGAEPPRPPVTTDEPAITKRADQLLERATDDEPYPFTCVLDEKRGRCYVSLWAQAAVAVVDLAAWRVVDRFLVEDHPNEMLLAPDGGRLFVANANRNSVSVVDLETGHTRETLVATLTPDAPPGNTPNSLALSADGARLFVANANINAVSVFDVSRPGAARSLGFIPTGWYPTSVRLAGGRLLVANGKGVVSDSNRNGPRPGFDPEAPTPDYIGRLFQGTVSFIDLPDAAAQDRQFGEWSAQAIACRPPSPAFDADLVAHGPVPPANGGQSPITHVIYVVKENRTYDQVLGDLPQGRGDPTLCLFPEEVTPNHHALAREFVLLDNFYVESEVSADGHEWTMGAYATDFVEKQWPLNYGHNRRRKVPYLSEGGFDAAARPAGGYLWDRAIAAGVSVRSYGEWVANGATPDQPARPRVKALEGRIDPLYRGFDMRYPDVKRAERFIAELARFEREGDMPRLQILRLPGDHTSGASPGLPTPRSCVADNDLALGRIVAAVSRSRFWPRTAIFVVEDDAQNGSDHIDAHRTVAFVASPYARRGAVDSTLYSTSSMLRTIELILGLEPMSQFDAAAVPMLACFTPMSDAAAYECRPARVPLDEVNVATAWGARQSLEMDFSREDAADDLLLNEIVWRSVRGPGSPMPPPRRAGFVCSEAEDGPRDEDD